MTPGDAETVASSREAVQRLETAYHAGWTTTAGAGRMRVAVVGADVPVEVLEAGGVVPVRLRGVPGAPTPDADRWLERGVDGATRSVLQQVLEGVPGAQARIVLCHDREATARLFFTLRELRRLRVEGELPALHLVDVLHRPVRTSTVYTRGRIADLRDRVATWTGRAVTDGDLRAAVRTGNRRRDRLQQLATLRQAGRITGTQALRIIGAATVLPADEYLALLDPVLAATPDAASPDPIRLMVTGMDHHTPGLYAELEGCGALVITEDHDHGDRWVLGRVSEDDDTLTALATHYQHGPIASAGHAIARHAVDTAARAVDAGAEAVVCFLRPGDHAPHWDVPDQRRELARRGLHLHVINLDAFRDTLTAQEVDRFRRFLASVRDSATGPPPNVHQEPT